MTKRERVIGAFRHERADIIPYDVGFTDKEHDIYAAYTGDADFASKIGNHTSGAYYSGFSEGLAGPVAGKPGYVADDFGVVWNRTVDRDIGVVDALVLPEPDISAFKPPKLDYDAMRRDFQNLLSRPDDTFKYGSVGFSMFERAWTLRGMENFLIDMVTEPSFAHALLDAVCDFNMRIIELGLSYDVDGFYFGDDWGQQKGLIMGPSLWREFIKPRVARMYAAVKAKGKFVIQHSCGDVSSIFADLIDIGLDCYQTFQPEIYDIRAVKAEYGRDLSFWGGISTQRLLPFASPDEIKAKTVEIMRVMGAGGGYIAAPTHAIPGDVPPENVAAMLDVFQNQGKYL